MSPAEVIEQAKIWGLKFEPDDGDVEIYTPGIGSYVSVHVKDGFAFPPDTSYGPLGMQAAADRCRALSCAFLVAAHLIDRSLRLNADKQLELAP